MDEGELDAFTVGFEDTLPAVAEAFEIAAAVGAEAAFADPLGAVGLAPAVGAALEAAVDVGVIDLVEEGLATPDEDAEDEAMELEKSKR